ncbi:MAG: ribosome maturation factor RimP [Gemmatimonadetes bacterium]|nr:ribosome maturation factor RimP [Gemmatimonadota bacterium]
MVEDLAALTTEVRTRVSNLGFELADLRKGGSRSRTLLQVRIDRPDASPGRGITVEECAQVSRALESWLDQAGILGPRYILEVSSPGIERPLRWREHWARFVGREVNVRLAGRGRVRATIVDVPEGRDLVVLKPQGNAPEITVPLAEARDATLAVDWNRRGQ